MKPEPNYELDGYRLQFPGYESPSGCNHGAFQVRGPLSSHGRATLRVISSGGVLTVKGCEAESEWEHVSVSVAGRCPTWDEMNFVKDLFWSEDETVLQFHPKKSQYVNNNPYVLHLWKKRGVDHETPPMRAV